MSGVWYVLVAALLWGTTGTAQALAPPGARPETVGALRLLIGGVALLLLARGRGALGGRPWPRRPVALGAGSMAAYQLLFFAGVARTGVAAGTMVAIGSAPIWAGILARLTLGERLRRRWLVATALAVAGCTLLVAGGRDVIVDEVGILLALGAGAAYAVSSLASKALLATQPPDAAMAVIFCGGALLLAPLLFTGELEWVLRPRGLMVALHLGLVATAAAYVLYARGLRLMPVATAVTLGLAEPLTATSLGLLLLGERFDLTTALGMGLLFAGLVILATGRRAVLPPPRPG